MKFEEMMGTPGLYTADKIPRDVYFRVTKNLILMKVIYSAINGILDKDEKIAMVSYNIIQKDFSLVTDQIYYTSYEKALDSLKLRRTTKKMDKEKVDNLLRKVKD
jgi:hypothetical protein